MTSCTTLRRKRWAQRAFLVVIVAVSACSGGNSAGHAPSTPVALGLPDLTGATVDVTTPLTQDGPRDGSPAPSPREAVLRFVRAEVAADTESSFDLLSEAYEESAIYQTSTVRQSLKKAAAEARNITNAR